MITMLKKIIFVSAFLLIIFNIVFFVHSISLASEINTFEQEIKRLHQNNLVLENTIFRVDSLQYAASIAAQLNFTQQPAPIYVHDGIYALNR